MKKLHLDSEYRNRWIEFHLADGTIEDSRLKNWRGVEWNKVIKITVHILGNIHEVGCDGEGFLTFMNFRWGGQEAQFDENNKFVGHKPIKIWSVGWTNGRDCFLKDLCFYTGKLIKEYESSINEFINHLHPTIKDRVKGI